jgi:membrane protease YdiL (CAAX protease family)
MNKALKKIGVGIVFILFWNGATWLLAQNLPNIFNGRLDVAPSLLAGRSMLYSTVAYLFFAPAFYYLANRTKPFPTLKVSLAHAGLGTALGCATAIICLISTPALYYHATRFTNPKLIEWVWAIGFFLGAAAFEEIIYRGVLQNFFELFLHPAVATVLQVALFAWGHPLPQTTSGIIWRIAALVTVGLFATLLAKKSPYLILPIFFHASENLFIALPNGLEGDHLPVAPVWNLGHMLNSEYKAVVVLIFIFGFWYFYGWNGTGRKKTGDSLQGI